MGKCQHNHPQKSEIKIKMVVYFLTFYTVPEGQKNPNPFVCKVGTELMHVYHVYPPQLEN